MISSAEPLSVLVVDDDTALTRTLSDILRLHGYDPTTALTGRQGLDAAGHLSRPPAVALVDLRLPDMDGLEVVSHLHRLSDLTQVVVLTGNASLDSAVAAMREHSIDYLVKPVQIENLLRAVSVAGERWQRRHAEEALKASEDRYRLLFERTPQPSWLFDRETLRFLTVNEAAVREYGYTRDEFLQMSIEDIRPASDIELLHRMLDVQMGGYNSAGLWTHRRKNGSLIQVEIASHDLEFGGRPARLVIASNVTERIQAVSALRARERQQAAVAELGQRAIESAELPKLLAFSAALVGRTLDADYTSILELQPSGKALILRAGVGWDASAIGQATVPADRTSQAGYTMAEKTPTILEDPVTEIRFIGGELSRQAEIVSGIMVCIPGQLRPFGTLGAHTRTRRQFNQDDVYFMQAVAHILGTAVERERSELAFRQSQRMEAVGRLAGGVAHDFNNMLTAITVYSELVLTELPEGDPKRDDLQEIRSAAARATGLTKQLLAFSRQQVLQPRVISLNDVLAETEKMLGRVIGEHINFQVRPAAELGAVKADPGQIEQVILNLVVNARDAMPDGGVVRIETENVALDREYAVEHLEGLAAGEYVMLAVTDTGVGMDRDTQARIFEPFFSTKGERGTGLGLATVYGIVRQSGGYIWVYSEPGHGTTFKVYLPRVDADPVTTPPEGARPVVPRGTETILLVEDEEMVRRIGVRVLRGAGYEILAAAGGADAIELAGKHEGTIHLLITDVIMPQMSGRELATRLAAQFRQLPILYLSGYTDPGLVSKGLLEGDVHFLQKPFTSQALLRKVREVLDHASRDGR